jgi:hypothetical protein
MLSMRDLRKAKRGEAEQESSSSCGGLLSLFWALGGGVRLEFGWCGGEWGLVSGSGLRL